MPDLESLSRGELIELAHEQAAVIERQNAQVAAMAGQIADLMGRLERPPGSWPGWSTCCPVTARAPTSPSSKEGTPNGNTPPAKPRRTSASGRKKRRQKRAPGSQLRWTEDPDDVKDLFPQGGCV
ncbi:hypothetical protein [Streptomyces sp. NPDC051219]|uniref:hypothetical protein n=1 Tax=Streptomyces sp. NPDC051219 TaxID=3155283 RepID=UPI003422D260